MWKSPHLRCASHQRIHQPANLRVADRPRRRRLHQRLPVHARVPPLPRVERRLRFRLVPHERRQRHVGVTDRRLP